MARQSVSRNSLKGSERQPLPGAKAVGKADPTERLEVSVLLRRRNGDRVDRARQEARDARRHRRPSQPRGVRAAVRRRQRRHRRGQEICRRRTGSRSSRNMPGGVPWSCRARWRSSTPRSGWTCSGSNTRAARIADGSAPSNCRTNCMAPSKPCSASTTGRSPSRISARARRGNVHWHANGGDATSFTPLQIASLYDFPAGTGQGQCVAIIELGGGERPADLSTYFSALGINPAPKVTAVSVDHGKNHPTGDPNGPDGEVMLDIEVVGAIAPAANIAVYFAPNTDAGFLDAITTAIHDTTNKPSVISISWGGPESSWTQQSMTAFD